MKVWYYNIIVLSSSHAFAKWVSLNEFLQLNFHVEREIILFPNEMNDFINLIL